MDRLEGQVFAGFRIGRRLGSGGMAVVYQAQHPRLPRKEALKILIESHSGDPEYQARFLREAELAARLDHPNLVAVHDRGIFHGRLWIAMQFIDGTDVATLIRRGPAVLPPERAIALVGEAARGLDEIHRAGLIHRDVKPANIMVTQGGDGRDRVLVADFGIARSTDDTASLTGSGAVLGSLAYIAPEQLEDGPVDHRVDIYSLGCTLYHMLTGTAPFPRRDPGSVVRAHLIDAPPRPSRSGRGLPVALDEVIATAMAKDPARRYRSCGQLAEAAALALGAAAETAPARRQRNPFTRPLSKRRSAVGAGALVLVLLAVVGALTLPDRLGTRTVSGTPAALATPPPTSSATPTDYSAWKSYAFVVAAFPSLVSAQPSSIEIGTTGECFPVDAQDNQTSVDTAATPLARVFCAGVVSPAESIDFVCRADRTPMPKTMDADIVGEGSQDWIRPSGSGQLIWGHRESTPGRVRGVLQIFFDSASRYFCSLSVTGATTGAELLQRWWPTAPL